MKNRNIWSRIGDFVLGKGFYIVLFLCVATIGISGYYLVRTVVTPLTTVPKVNTGDTSAGISSPVKPNPDTGTESGTGTAGTGTGQGEGSRPAAQKPEATQKTKPASDTPSTPSSAADPDPSTEASGTVTDIPAPETAPLPTFYTWPVRGAILREYSMDVLTLDPTLGDWRTHSGLDVASTAGAQVRALADGTVTQVYNDDLMGTTVMIQHGGGLTSLCSGLAETPAVTAGQQVEAGDIIGSVGSTAKAESSLAPHVHIETWMDGAPADPMDYLPEH